MTGSRPRTEWSSPNIVLTIVLALLAAQQAFNNFNDSTRDELSAIKSKIAVLEHRLDRLDRDLRDPR